MQRRWFLAGLIASLGCVANAQDTLPSLPIVVLDREALFIRSQFGQRVRADIEAASRALGVENRRIEAELEAEEQDLTERRATMDIAEFRKLADAFDQKVEGIRQAQAAKERAIISQTERAQALFLERANPVLSTLAEEVGAQVILDRRFVIDASEQVDITQIALERIDAVLGAGERINVTPSPRPDAAPTAPGQQ